jgi:hypothetical protein
MVRAFLAGIIQHKHFLIAFKGFAGGEKGNFYCLWLAPGHTKPLEQNEKR